MWTTSVCGGTIRTDCSNGRNGRGRFRESRFYRVSQVVFEVRIDGRRVAETPPLFNGDRAWGIDLAIPAGSHEIALAVKDVGSRITDPHGHGDWLNAGFVTV